MSDSMAQPRTFHKLWKYCPSCNNVAKFDYDRIIGHSRCRKCGQTGYVPAMNEEGERKLRSLIRSAWERFDKGEWQRTDHDTVVRKKPGWLIAEEKE